MHESHWAPAAAVVVAMLLHVGLPGALVIGPGWVVPVLEAALLIPLVLTRPHRSVDQSVRRRRLALTLTALLTVANGVALVLLVHDLVRTGPSAVGGRSLVLAALSIWLTNVVAFALWYWELDAGGPAARSGQLPRRDADFLFPQGATPEAAAPGWRPLFVDYLYVSFTNSTAFSPTDTMPLSRIAKALMMVQSAAALLVVVLVAGRAVNILG